MYEMEGASSALPHQGSQSPGQLALRAARQGQAPARKSGFPVFPTFRSFPRVVPVSDGELFLSLPRTPRKSFSGLFQIISLSTLYPQIPGSFPPMMLVIHGIIHNSSTDYQQITRGNSANTLVAFAAGDRSLFDGDLSGWGGLVATAGPARLALVQERPHPLPRVGELAGRGHDLDGVGVGLGLVQVDLGV